MILSKEVNRLSGLYRWKAECIVRFLTLLNMTEEEKIEFIAKELAMAQIYGKFHTEIVSD